MIGLTHYLVVGGGTFDVGGDINRKDMSVLAARDAKSGWGL